MIRNATAKSVLNLTVSSVCPSSRRLLGQFADNIGISKERSSDQIGRFIAAFQHKSRFTLDLEKLE